MLIFQTLNSTYEITVVGSLFQIKKVVAHQPSDYLEVGDPRLSDRIYVQVGDRARFAGWSTSRVIAIGEKRPEVSCPAI